MNSGQDTPHKILLGAAEIGFRERLDIIVKLTEQGHNTQIIYPLGSERDLWPIHEPLTAKLVSIRIQEPLEIVLKKFNESFATVIEMHKNRDSHSDSDLTKETNIARNSTVKYYTDKGIAWPTEKDMMDYIINNEYKEKLPNIQFKNVISADNKLNDVGQLVRADTYDTLVKMWEIYGDEITSSITNNESIPMSIVTIQPFGHYQRQQTIKAFHNKPINILVVAEGVDPNNINLSSVLVGSRI